MSRWCLRADTQRILTVASAVRNGALYRSIRACERNEERIVRWFEDKGRTLGDRLGGGARQGRAREEPARVPNSGRTGVRQRLDGRTPARPPASPRTTRKGSREVIAAAPRAP